MGVLNDDISSIKVSSGYQVQVFADDNFSGNSITITADNACLLGNNFTDIISSLKVRSTSATSTARETISSTTNTIGTGDRLIIYPNPVGSELHFNTSLPLSGTVIRIVDMMGREVIRTTSATGIIDISKISSGVYTLSLTGNGKTLTQRFVK